MLPQTEQTKLLKLLLYQLRRPRTPASTIEPTPVTPQHSHLPPHKPQKDTHRHQRHKTQPPQHAHAANLNTPTPPSIHPPATVYPPLHTAATTAKGPALQPQPLGLRRGCTLPHLLRPMPGVVLQALYAASSSSCMQSCPPAQLYQAPDRSPPELPWGTITSRMPQTTHGPSPPPLVTQPYPLCPTAHPCATAGAT